MFMEEGRPTLTVGGGTIPWDGDQNHMKGEGKQTQHRHSSLSA